MSDPHNISPIPELPVQADLSKKSDEELAEGVKRNEKGAFSELMKRHMNHILNFVRQYAKNEEEAEDIVQDAFFKAWRHIGQFKKDKKFRPWLFAIARNTALDQLKKKRAVSFSELDNIENDLSFADTLDDPEPLPPEIFERRELGKELMAVMDTLPPDWRAVLIMHYNDDMTFDEIADVVGRPMNTVKSWHRRALIRIRSLLTHQKT